MWVFAVLLILSSCSRLDYIDTTNLILTRQSKELCKEENIRISGMGGAMLDKITSVSVDFTAERVVGISEARILIVKCIERLRSALNSNYQIKDYLFPFPFPVNAMDIGIFFQKNGSYVEYGCVWLGTGGVSLVFQLKDKLFYSSYNSRTQLLEDYYEEPYEVALEIVRPNRFLNNPCNLHFTEKVMMVR